jgi:phosphoglycerate dehydrogenase-like enzyme
MTNSGFDLEGKTIGIVGVGKIGEMIKSQPLRMKIFGCDPNLMRLLPKSSANIFH